MVRFASIVAAAGAAALAYCGTAWAASDITLAAIATGRLYVAGTTDRPHAPVVLENQFRMESDDKGRFQYELVYHPSRCIVSASVDGKVVEAVVSNCSQQCQVVPRDNTAAPAAAAAAATTGPLPAKLGPGAAVSGTAPGQPVGQPPNRAAATTPPARTGVATAPGPAVPKPAQIERPPRPPQRPFVQAPSQDRVAPPPKPARKPRPAPRPEPDDAGPPIAD